MEPGQLEELRAWGRQLSHDGANADLRACGRAILLLVDEVENLRGAGAPPPDEPPDDPPGEPVEQPRPQSRRRPLREPLSVFGSRLWGFCPMLLRNLEYLSLFLMSPPCPTIFSACHTKSSVLRMLALGSVKYIPAQ